MNTKPTAPIWLDFTSKHTPGFTYEWRAHRGGFLIISYGNRIVAIVEAGDA